MIDFVFTYIQLNNFLLFVHVNLKCGKHRCKIQARQHACTVIKTSAVQPHNYLLLNE